ncbi:inhibitor of growth protein 1 [Nasonia vitripennis]|uniref:Inhibitor of growth protein n=1 Tax=Nasonia vitripennis TaxID=7425 RepID=A0A7M7LLP0_NASVI|nr:inhibitor of growth protein 1 [Nasonia vitripennis]
MVNPPPDEDPEWPVVRYITNYMDAMENLPDALAKLTSRMYQLDANCQDYYREIQEHHDILARGIADVQERRRVLAKVQNTLVHMQDIGDEKLQLMQTIHDMIEKKARGLDIDLKNARPRMEQENSVPFNASNSNSVSSNPKPSTPINEKTTRRGRRTKNGISEEQAAQAADSSVLSENQSANLPSTSNGVSKRTSNTGTGKRKQRKSLNNHQNQGQGEASATTPAPVASPTPAPASAAAKEEEDGEPLYCVCNRVSFGKMIMCDNDACLAEWFHFSCVNLTIKPKGKWYCPSCRGSKPNLPKPKSKFR